MRYKAYLLLILLSLGCLIAPAQAQFPMKAAALTLPAEPSASPSVNSSTNPLPDSSASINPSVSPSPPSKHELTLNTEKLVETLLQSAVIKNKKQLFFREDLGFDKNTLAQGWGDLQQFPNIQQKKLAFSLSETTWFSLVLWVGWLFLFLGLAWFVDRRSQRLPIWVRRQLPPQFPVKYLILVSAFSRLSARLLTPLFFLVLFFLIKGFLGFQDWAEILILSAGLFAVYRLISHFLSTLLGLLKKSNLYPVPTKPLYWITKGFLTHSCFFLGIFYSLKIFSYSPAVLAFIAFFYKASVLIYFFYLISHREFIMDLFLPEDEFKSEDLIKKFVSAFAYFSLALGLFWLAGYHYFVKQVFFKIWGALGLFLLAFAIYRGLKYVLYKFIAEGNLQSKLVHHTLKGILLVECVTLFYALLNVTGLNDFILHTLGFPILFFSKRPISILSLMNGAFLFLFFWFITQIILAFLEEKFYPHRSFDTGVHQIINTLTFYLIMSIGAVLTLNVVGVDLSSLTIFAGALAFGVGFGLQGIAKSFASGLILIFTGLVKKGDYITVEENTGYIKQVSWKNVHITTTDQVDLIVPTVNLMESTIINWTYSGNIIRVHIPIGVSYNADADQVKEVLLEAAGKHKMILDLPRPEVWLVEFGDNSINFELLVWIDYEKITVDRLKGELNFFIWRALKEADIEIPFPQRDIHIRSGHLMPVDTKQDDSPPQA